MTRYRCKDCGHDYGARVPSAPLVQLHLAVSHGGNPPIGPAPCAVCVHRATHYGLGPCASHAGDVWAGAR